MSIGVLGVFRCEVSMRSSAGGGGLAVGGVGFSGGKLGIDPMVDVSMESSVLVNLCFKERECVDVEWEDVECLFLCFFLWVRLLCLPSLFFFPILIGLVALVLR